MSKVTVIEVGMPGPQGPSGSAEIAAHVANHDNPHLTTKAQVGLGNADNTSDADKPISAATAAALAAKANTLAVSDTSSIDLTLASDVLSAVVKPAGIVSSMVSDGTLQLADLAPAVAALVTGRVTRVLTVTDNVTITTADYIDTIFLPMQPYEKWVFEWWLNTYCSNPTGVPGGMKFGLIGPTGTTFLAHVDGTTTSQSARTMERLSTNGGLSTTNFGAFTVVNGRVGIIGSVECGETASNLSAIWAIATAGQTGYIEAGSTLRAERATP